MAPIRRYLRITKYSVLEVRVYLDNPALASTWLLNPRDPVLPRVIQAVRPLVLPKLREENERAKGKGKKSKGVKDVVHESKPGVLMPEGGVTVMSWEYTPNTLGSQMTSKFPFSLRIYLHGILCSPSRRVSRRSKSRERAGKRVICRAGSRGRATCQSTSTPAAKRRIKKHR